MSKLLVSIASRPSTYRLTPWQLRFKLGYCPHHFFGFYWFSLSIVPESQRFTKKTKTLHFPACKQTKGEVSLQRYLNKGADAQAVKIDQCRGWTCSGLDGTSAEKRLSFLELRLKYILQPTSEIEEYSCRIIGNSNESNEVLIISYKKRTISRWRKQSWPGYLWMSRCSFWTSMN